jgi:uncharacterized membrane protein
MMMRYLKSANVWLWVLQAFLALFFAFGSGLPKWILPDELLAANMPIPLPRAFVYTIGTFEILGALGLILPGVTRVRPGLTVLAALGLVLLTLCATSYQLLAQQPGSAVFALMMSIVCGLVAYGRWCWAPLRGRRQMVVAGAAAGGSRRYGPA